MRLTLYSSLLGFLLCLPALADPKPLSIYDDDCLPDRSLCWQEDAFIWRNGRFELLQITGTPMPGEKIIVGSGEPVPRKDVASLHGETCAKVGTASICPGTMMKDNTAQPGVVLGVFPDNTVAFAPARQKLRRLPAAVLKANSLDETDLREVRELARSLTKINEVLNIAWPASCDEPPAAPKAPDEAQVCAADGPAAELPKRKYFEELLARGMSAPLTDFLQLWHPEKGDGLKVDSELFNCEAGEMGAFTGAVQAGREERCRPEVLYSWGPAAKVAEVTKNLADGQDWKGKLVNPPANYAGAPGTVYSTVSPVSTFGYGERLLRFKLKPGAKFVESYTPGDEAAVNVRTADRFHDFTFRNGELIESISTGTPEIYDEVVRDILRYQANKRVFAYFAPKNNTSFDEFFMGSKETPVFGIERLYGQSVDGRKQNEETLKAHLLELIREILAGEGKVQFAQDACRSRAQHYLVTKKTHFNPN